MSEYFAESQTEPGPERLVVVLPLWVEHSGFCRHMDKRWWPKGRQMLVKDDHKHLHGIQLIWKPMSIKYLMDHVITYQLCAELSPLLYEAACLRLGSCW
jgi:hypothetical protein